MESAAAKRLTERQKECLRLVAQGLETKEIARLLDLTPAAVTERLRAARTIFGVATSREAARRLQQLDGEGAYNRFGDMPAGLSLTPEFETMGWSGREENRSFREEQAPFSGPASPGEKPLLDRLGIRWRSRDELTPKEVLLFTAGAVTILMVLLVGATNILETLTKLHRYFQ
jgi:DNA-binding CsgD family transcriptional regulator